MRNFVPAAILPGSLPPVGPLLAALKAGKMPKTGFARQRAAGSRMSEGGSISNRLVLGQSAPLNAVLRGMAPQDQAGTEKRILAGGVFA